MQFYKQRDGHYFKLHARAPSADVPRWGDKRIDATWQHRPGSTLAQIMACCLTSPSHYLNQCWLFVKGFVWHSAESNFIQHAHALNSLRPRQNRRYNADEIFKCIFLNENVWLPTKISLKFVPKGPINNIPALVLIMAWRRPGDKPLSEPLMVSLLTHICVTRPQWVNP